MRRGDDVVFGAACGRVPGLASRGAVESQTSTNDLAACTDYLQVQVLQALSDSLIRPTARYDGRPGQCRGEFKSGVARGVQKHVLGQS